jgi:hypothetical protein
LRSSSCLLYNPLRVKGAGPRDVPTGPLQIGDQSTGNWIDYHSEDDGDGRGCVLGSHSPYTTHHTDHVHLETDQFGGKFRQAVEPPLRPSVLDDDVPALNIAEVAKPLLERLECG